MKCGQCGEEMPANASFCQHCGERLVDPWAEPAATEQGRAEDRPTVRDQFRQSAADRQSNGEPETAQWEGTYSIRAMFGLWVTAGILTIFGIIVALITIATGFGWLIAIGLIVAMWVGLFLWLWYQQFSVYYELTSQRLIHQKGLLWRTSDRIELIDVDDVTFIQGPIERILDVGTIHISSSDRTHPEIELPGIENVKRIAGKIDDLRREERRRRGLHIENV
jgi:membrane protein YdbS with pleckstrin-like domain